MGFNSAFKGLSDLLYSLPLLYPKSAFFITSQECCLSFIHISEPADNFLHLLSYFTTQRVFFQLSITPVLAVKSNSPSFNSCEKLEFFFPTEEVQLSVQRSLTAVRSTQTKLHSFFLYFVDRESQYNLFSFISNLIHCFPSTYSICYPLSSTCFRSQQANHQEV